jgi:hypothetical protein
MKTIRLKNKNVSLSQIASWEESYREVRKDVVEPGYGGINKVIGHKIERETILKLELINGDKECLYGSEADADLAILKSSNG